MFGLAAIDLVIVACFVFLSVLIGLWSRKKVHSVGDFFLANRCFGKVFMIAQSFGSGTHTAQPVSVAGASYTEGLSGIWYQWLWLFSTPFYWLLAPIYRRLRYITIADFYKERYGAGMALVYVLFGIAYFCMNIGLVLKGAGTIIAGVTDGAISPAVSIALITCLFLLYGITGGLHAVVLTDILQGVLTLVMSFLILPFALVRAGSMRVLHEGLPEYMFDLVNPGEMSLFFVVMIILNGLVGIVVHPHHMAMNGSGRSEMACRMGWTFGSFLKRFATIGWVFIGVFAAFLFPGLVHENRELAFGLAAKKLLPAGMLGLMLSSFLAAGMSTCDGFMVHASALLTHNIYGAYVDPNAAEDKKLRFGRFFSVLVAAGGISCAFAFDSVVNGMLTLLGISSFLGLSFWAGILWKRANRYGAFASVVIMVAAASYSKYILGWGIASQTALYLGLGIITLVVVSLSSRHEPERQLIKFFALLDTPVGKENELHEAGIEIILEGCSEPAAKSAKFLPPRWFTEEESEGLLIVDLSSLQKKFAWCRHRIDVAGFMLAALLVAALIFVLLMLAQIGK